MRAQCEHMRHTIYIYVYIWYVYVSHCSIYDGSYGAHNTTRSPRDYPPERQLQGRPLTRSGLAAIRSSEAAINRKLRRAQGGRWSRL
eukprot:601228-Pyramimonas_sp.AAC.1